MNPSTAQATVLVDELIRCGVRDAVLCPGSRNAPLAFAVHAADAAGRLRLHVRIDERSAGYLAVGIATRSRRPVPVMCTSGTAAANVHPAVLEASYSGAALIVVTADRPVELHGTGASQTIEQDRLYGNAARSSVVLPVAEPRTGQQALWRSAVDRSVATATGVASGDPGPVHINVPFREPLVPDGDNDWREPLSGRDADRPWTEVAPRREELDPLPLDPDAPTLAVGGQGGLGVLPPEIPVVAEPGSPLWDRSLRTGVWLLPEVLTGSMPELLPRQVVVLGRPTLHRSVQRLLADPRIEVFAVPPTAPGASRPLWTDTAGSVRAVGALPKAWAPPAGFGRIWQELDVVAADTLDISLDTEPWCTGPGLARAMLATLPDGSLLFAGPSNPVRDIALAAKPRDDVTVDGNRGVAGIDGVVSAAVGAAMVHSGPSYALVGDLTFRHDANGLLLGPQEPCPDLTIVVANDDGGSVFALLEQGAPEHARVFERVFATPHGSDIAALCRATGVAYARVEQEADLPAALEPKRGLRVVEVPVDRGGRRELHQRLRDVVGAAVTQSRAEP